MSIKVLYIISSLRRSGPVNVLYSIVKDARTNNIEPVIVTLKPESKRSRLSAFTNLNIKIINVGRNNLTLKKILKVIDDENIEVVHSHGIIPDFINSLIHKKRKNMYCISTLHNFPFEDYKFAYGRIRGLVLAIVHYLIIRRLICVSCSDTIQKKFRKLHLSTISIPNGVDLPDYSMLMNAHKKYGNVFLYLGEINKRKNVQLLMEAFKILTQYELLIVGDGPELDALKKQNDCKNIKFLGRTENPASFFLESDYYISASLSEGLPMACLEAMSYGLPVILSDIGPHKEIMNEEVGVTFSSNNLEDLLKKIRKILSMNIDSREVYEYIQNKYDSTRVSREYAILYNDLIEN
ncbi:glycosyltransferase [Loigolactobacillus zhaoyuanensis]|uniref:glycosyltransferase n=1 Tax=Loigolactobacillus zhaoyuanensis TaxID=2486017 RepID=UPI000F7464DA|nr:glycosyltransferase [Loigolactobacillus zhaoyuanensis]